MIEVENRCVGCAPERGCMGRGCPNREVEVLYCDRCGDEISFDDAYVVDGEDLCEDCLKDEFRRRS